MELLLILIYVSICYVVFKVFKIRVNQWSLATAALGGIIGIALLLPKRQPENPITELERALAAGEFVPYYQPIVDIRSGRLRGAEVLARWKKPDGTLVSPASFIPLAESSGLIVELTRVLMRRMCRELGPAFGRRPHVKISFNLTARHFADEEIVKDVRQIFSEVEGEIDPGSTQGSGDVKYHLGATGVRKASSGREIMVSVAPNPSHLEAVDPGQARRIEGVTPAALALIAAHARRVERSSSHSRLLAGT